MESLYIEMTHEGHDTKYLGLQQHLASHSIASPCLCLYKSVQASELRTYTHNHRERDRERERERQREREERRKRDSKFQTKRKMVILPSKRLLLVAFFLLCFVSITAKGK